MFIYSVYDKKGMCYRSQFFAQNDAEAIRAVARSANDSRTDLNMFSADFALYCNGEFNINSGSVAGIVPLKHIVDVNSLIRIDKVDESN